MKFQIEKIPIVTYISNDKDFYACEQLWEEDDSLTEEKLKQVFESHRKFLMNEYPLGTREHEHAKTYFEWNSIVNQLERGKVVGDMFNLYRAKNDLPKCPRCGCSYKAVEDEAVSRKDNKTLVCSDCGTKEALGLLRVEDIPKNLN